MENISNFLNQAISQQSSFAYILLLSFLAGILISFTPCVYPMIPITVGVLQTQASRSIFLNFLSALFYVLGLALIYACLGVIAASTSMIFGRWMANPFFIFFIIILFIYLAFSLFGFYEIKLPRFLAKSADLNIQAPILKSFLMGLLSGAIASPCITPVLAVLLALVAEKGNPILGFFALFFFAMGMGILLILVGTFSATLNILPGAGEWMLEVKKVLGFVMLAMCVYFAKPLMPIFWIKILYALVFLSMLVYLAIRIISAKILSKV